MSDILENIDVEGASCPGYRRVKYLIASCRGYMDILVHAACSTYPNDPLFRAHVTKLLDM